MNVQRLLAATTLAFSACAAFALPSVDEVQAAVRAGHYTQAESMMQEVVTAKPGSARAHYIYAEILAHDAHFAEAARQAETARTLDPAIGFTDKAKFEQLQQLLAREQRALTASPSPNAGAAPLRAQPAERAGGVPGWVWIVGLGAFGAFAWSMLKRGTRQQPQGYGGATMAGANGMNGFPAGPGYGPGYAPPQAPGSGLLGVGLAAAGGVAAGMLAEKLIEGHRGGDASSNWGNPAAPLAGNEALGAGLFPGGDDGAARDLEQRPIDFGSGDGWGGGDDGSLGGGGSDGGW
ncbi:MAG: tetratricopeptide repeat protein [Burkholderiales bacterium]|nr:tetratricopeptide repeat protein [Burkholderiales bacterium]